jgi:hypothetical protein
MIAGWWWFMPVILPTQEAAIRRIVVQSQPRVIDQSSYIKRKKKTQHRKGLVEWLKW